MVQYHRWYPSIWSVLSFFNREEASCRCGEVFSFLTLLGPQRARGALRGARAGRGGRGKEGRGGRGGEGEALPGGAREGGHARRRGVRGGWVAARRAL